MSSEFNSIESNVSLIVISFSFLCLVLIIIFITIIFERICPLFCLCCCPNNCHKACSSKIHRLSDTYYISRKQLSLTIKQRNTCLNHLSLNSQSVTNTPITTSHAPSHSNTNTQTSINPIEKHLELTHVATSSNKPSISNRQSMPPLHLINNQSSNKPYRSIAGIPIESDIDDINIMTISPNLKQFNLPSPPSSPPQSPPSQNDESNEEEINILVDIDGDTTKPTYFAKMIICCCIPYCYWDSIILHRYKKRRSRELNNGTISKSFKARIIANISYFGLSMNIILFLQCVSIFVLYEFDSYSYGLFINLYFIAHNLWLILCNVSLTGILLNVLEIVRSTNEDGNINNNNKKRLNYTFISFCLLFIICTISFHIFCIIFNTVYWDIIGGIVRNLLISILCIILAKNTLSLKKSVSLAFSRVSNSINNIHQINEHKKIINVLIILFISSIILAILVSFAALQYFSDLLSNNNSKLSISKQPIPGTFTTDILWLFIKLMSSFIILYYAIINIKQRRKLMISIINEQIAMIKDKQRSKRKRSYIQHKAMQTV